MNIMVFVIFFKINIQINYEKMCHSLDDQLGDYKTKHDENTRLIAEINAQRAKLQNENGEQQS